MSQLESDRYISVAERLRHSIRRDLLLALALPVALGAWVAIVALA
jgi:hypothetical protein